MKKGFLPVLLVSFLATSALCQDFSAHISFTGVKGSINTRLDSIRIENITHAGDTMLYWPDTVLSMAVVGIEDKPGGEAFTLFQSYPNPSDGISTVRMFIPSGGKVVISVSDLIGRKVTGLEQVLSSGYHRFLFNAGSEKVYLLSVSWNSNLKVIRLLNTNSGEASRPGLVYQGSDGTGSSASRTKAIAAFKFYPGDRISVTGYSDTLTAALHVKPTTSNPVYTLNFTLNVPCPGTPTVFYDGFVYNTVQISSQCWLKENLRVGVQILATHTSTNDDTIEKYCYNNIPANCVDYGALYSWSEMMKYTTASGGQGICPTGWHVPTADEFEVLGQALGGVQIAGGKMKETGNLHWLTPNNAATNESGFTALGSGYCSNTGTFSLLQNTGYFWTSTGSGQTADAYSLLYYYQNLGTYGDPKSMRLSVRCLKN